jgi:AraC-like DNA-binding protein
MFVEVLRRHLEKIGSEQTGWLAGLRDPHTGRALSLLHEKPKHAWTLDELAQEVGLSRSALAERFTHLVGQPPMQYLSQWRMQIAAGMLTKGAKVLEAAFEVGYDSEAAFSRAFKRLVGVSPAAWRDRRSADVSMALKNKEGWSPAGHLPSGQRDDEMATGLAGFRPCSNTQVPTDWPSLYPSSTAVGKWMPAKTREAPFSRAASEKLQNLREIPA